MKPTDDQPAAQRFRKKPVVIEAMEYTRESRDAVIAWCGATGTGINDDGAEYELRSIRIHTLEGVMRADLGDWIIRGVQGEFYPCKPDIFEATYEPAFTSPTRWSKAWRFPRSHRMLDRSAVKCPTCGLWGCHDERKHLAAELAAQGRDCDHNRALLPGTTHKPTDRTEAQRLLNLCEDDSEDETAGIEVNDGFGI